MYNLLLNYAFQGTSYTRAEAVKTSVANFITEYHAMKYREGLDGSQ